MLDTGSRTITCATVEPAMPVVLGSVVVLLIAAYIILPSILVSATPPNSEDGYRASMNE
jgi:hypothetical protein